MNRYKCCLNQSVGINSCDIVSNISEANVNQRYLESISGYLYNMQTSELENFIYNVSESLAVEYQRNFAYVLNIASFSHDFAHSLGDSFHSNAGLARYGNNMRLYMPSLAGKSFHGNRYINTYSLKSFGGNILKYSNPIGYGLAALKITLGIHKDGGFGNNTQLATMEVAGHKAGMTIGSKAVVSGLAMTKAKKGAAIGAVVGAKFFGVGAIPGAIIGGIVGGLVGAWGGKKLGQKALKK